MSDQAKQSHKDNHFLRTAIISAICIPVIVWLLYNAYQKSKDSSIKTITSVNHSCHWK